MDSAFARRTKHRGKLVCVKVQRSRKQNYVRINISPESISQYQSAKLHAHESSAHRTYFVSFPLEAFSVITIRQIERGMGGGARKKKHAVGANSIRMAGGWELCWAKIINTYLRRDELARIAAPMNQARKQIRQKQDTIVIWHRDERAAMYKNDKFGVYRYMHSINVHPFVAYTLKHFSGHCVKTFCCCCCCYCTMRRRKTPE